MSITLIIAAGVLALYLLLWLLSYLMSKPLSDKVADAVSALEIPDELYEFIDEKQATILLNKYGKLYNKVKKVQAFARFFPYSLSNHEKFLSLYDTYSERVSFHNRRENTRIYITEELNAASQDFYEATNEKYFTASSLEKLKKTWESFFDCLSCIKELKLEKEVDYESCMYLQELSTETSRLEHNRKYVENELEWYKEFFDKALVYPLDEQQRKAIVEDEDNNLVISSAGSGKTSTIVGKTKYLVDVKGVRPEEILLITFTRKAAAELSERLNIPGLTACTFHKLALDITRWRN